MPTSFQFRRANTANVSSTTLSSGEIFVDIERNSSRGMITLHDGVHAGGIDVGHFELKSNTFLFLPHVEQRVVIGKITSNTSLKLEVNGAIGFSNSLNNELLNGTVSGIGSHNLGAAGETDGSYASVLGGIRNKSLEDYTVTVGGANNVSGNTYSFVGGGNHNKLTSKYSAIVSGLFNTIHSSFDSFIGGGQKNSIYASDYGFVGGGSNNTIEFADYASVLGGRHNVANGNYSVALGKYAVANNKGSFVFGDSSDTTISSHLNNQIKFQASGGFWIDANTDTKFILPQIDTTYDIGQSNLRYRFIYANTINTNEIIGVQVPQTKKHEFTGNNNADKIHPPETFISNTSQLFIDGRIWNYYEEITNANGNYYALNMNDTRRIPDNAEAILYYQSYVNI